MSMDIESSSTVKEDQQKLYKYWRFRIMIAMMLGYAFFYFIRVSYPAIIKPLENDLGYSKSQIGAVLGVGAILYGVGKSFAGIIGDRVSAKWLMSIGLILSGACSLYFGMSSHLSEFMVAYALNMCFQSLGWPSCARLLTHWFSARELATKWAVWNCSQQIGSASIMLLSGWILLHYNWRYVLFISASISMVMAIVLFFSMKDTPESLGLPSIEEHHGLKKEEVKDDESFWHVLFHKVLANKLVWYLCLANFFIYIIRISAFTWGPTLLQEVKGTPVNIATSLTAAYDFAGIFGGVFAGYLSDRFFKGYRGRVGSIFMFGISIAILILWFSPPEAIFLHLLAMMLIGFLIIGPQILVGVAAVDFSSKRTAGVATGLTGTIGYVGTTFATAGFGALVQYCGWDYAFMCMIASSLLGSFFFALTWNNRSKTLG